MRGKVNTTAGWFLLVLVATARFAVADTDPRIAEAVKRHDDQAARALLKQHADVNAPLPDGTTALHWAAHWDNLEILDLLIHEGARTTAKDDYGVTPLSLACTNGNAQIVQKLLKAGADPNAALPSGETVLMTAAHTGKAAVVALLLEQGAVVEAKETSHGQTALMWAAAEGHAEAAQALIMRGADVHARSTAGYTPLVLSARSGDLGTAKVLLQSGADVNEAAPDGTTALVVATIRGHTALVKFLLEQHANANAGPGFTPLHWAAGEWNLELAGRMGLKDEGSEWGILEGLQGQAKLELVKLLLAHGASPNARAEVNPRYESGPRMGGGSNARGSGNAGGSMGGPSMAGATPFWIAAKAGNVEVMQLLVDSGADPSLATNRKTTPLMAAAGVGGGTGNTPVLESKALEAVRLCLELGNDINAANVDGATALHGAAFRGPQGEDALIQFLVDKGAKVNVRDKRGWTPLAIVEGLYFAATNTYSPSAVELLRKLGAEPTPPGLDRNVGTTNFGYVNQ